jgi:hypothetical protein
MRHIWARSSSNLRIWDCPGCSTTWVGDVYPTPGRPVLFEQGDNGTKYFQPCRIGHPNRFMIDFHDCDTMRVYHVQES